MQGVQAVDRRHSLYRHAFKEVFWFLMRKQQNLKGFIYIEIRIQ